MTLSEVYSTVITNPLAVTMASGLIIYLCKSLPSRIYHFFLDTLTTNVTVYQDQNLDAYESIEYLLNDSKILYIQSRFQLIYRYMLKKLELSCDEEALYFCKLGGIWTFITKQTDSQVQLYRTFVYKIRFMSKNKNKIEKYLQDSYKYQNSLSDDDNIRIYHYIENNWIYSPKRKTDCELMLSKDKQQVINKIAYFLNNEEEYHKKNKPYKEGLILYGQPGCGKSFFIAQLASMFDLNIYYMNLNNFSTESEFLKAIISINNPAIILIEDIDANKNLSPRKASHDKTKVQDKLKEVAISAKNSLPNNNGLTLSTVLNVLDGILSQEGQITIITTNYLDKLDPALIRSGRFDSRIEFKLLTKKEVIKFINTWYNRTDCFDLKNYQAISIADLSNICNRNNTRQKAILEVLNWRKELSC